MKRSLSYILSFFLVLASAQSVLAQEQPFYGEIQAFKKQDSASFPRANAILFVGSSSFRKWTDVAAYFPGYNIVNRGFGGSTLPDVIRYANDIIIPYKPKQVLVYCGDNDLASSDTVTPQIVLGRFKTLFNIIRLGLPNANIAYVAIKPSPSREQLMSKMIEANRLIKAFLNKQKNTSFINVFKPMLVNGKADPSLFIEDNLHMNAKGYGIWQRIIKPYLKK